MCILCASLGQSDNATVPIQTGRRRPTLSYGTSSVQAWSVAHAKRKN